MLLAGNQMYFTMCGCSICLSMAKSIGLFNSFYLKHECAKRINLKDVFQIPSHVYILIHIVCRLNRFENFLFLLVITHFNMWCKWREHAVIIADCIVDISSDAFVQSNPCPHCNNGHIVLRVISCLMS
jgi:hypothetical protein